MLVPTAQDPRHPGWMHTASYLNHLMLVLNSSVNFLIYCFVGRRFRAALVRGLGGSLARPGPRSSNTEITFLRSSSRSHRLRG